MNLLIYFTAKVEGVFYVLITETAKNNNERRIFKGKISMCEKI